LAAGSGNQANRCSWLSCGRPTGCRCSKSESADGYPREVTFTCGRLVMLSREHAILLAGFFIAPILLLLEFMMEGERRRTGVGHRSHTGMLAVVLNEICLIVLLTRFEEIDVIQQLEREVAQLKKAEQTVQNQREKMHEFWSQAQQLTELWLYRTVPRMDLYKEVHSHLEDAPNEHINQWMFQANQQLEMIDNNLGELRHWRNEGELSLEAKKTFGKTINLLCQEQDFEQMAKKLDDMAKYGMKSLEAGSNPPQSFSSSPGGVLSKAKEAVHDAKSKTKDGVHGGLERLVCRTKG